MPIKHDKPNSEYVRTEKYKAWELQWIQTDCERPGRVKVSERLIDEQGREAV